MKIHQTLHGYEGGHRLLASSTPLPRTVEQLLAVQSDLSGPSRAPGFDSYLTGYPLKEIGVYAFARTWYASEGIRPGCVWTHTLLIAFEVLSHLEDIAFLKRFFRRPDKTTHSSKEYGSEITVEDACSYEQCSLGVSQDIELVSDVVAAVYECKTRPVLLPANDSEELEDLVLGVWSRQWPSLRCSFIFSTGSLSNRVLEGKPFELQVVPANTLRSIQRSLSESFAVDFPSLHSDRPHWVEWVAKDLLGMSGPRFRRRWQDFGRELPAEPQYYPLVATLAAREKREGAEPTPGEIVEAIKSDAEPDLFALLLYYALDNRKREMFGCDRTGVLREMVTTPLSQAYDQVGIPAPEKTQCFVDRFPSEAIRLLHDLPRQTLNSVGQRLAESMLQSLALRPSADIVSALRDMVPILVSLNPEFCAIPETWRGTQGQSYEIFEVLARKEAASVNLRSRTVEAILVAQQHWLAWQVVRRLGPETLGIVLDWFNRSQIQNPNLLSRNWREVLAAHAEVTLSWLRRALSPLRLSTLGLISTYISPNCQTLEEVPPNVWLSALDDHARDYSADLLDRTSAFVLTVGMRGTAPTGAELVVRTFGQVHDSIMRGRLDDDAWRWISDHVPDLGFFRNWDRAERLRRGVIVRFRGNRWPLTLFGRLISSLPTCHLEYLGKSCDRTREGRLLLAEVLDLAKQGGAPLSDEQIAALRGHLS